VCASPGDRSNEILKSDKFNRLAFHDEVLDSGALPLDDLDSEVENWISQQATQ